jgi:hypothetical protein
MLLKDGTENTSSSVCSTFLSLLMFPFRLEKQKEKRAPGGSSKTPGLLQLRPSAMIMIGVAYLMPLV